MNAKSIGWLVAPFLLCPAAGATAAVGDLDGAFGDRGLVHVPIAPLAPNVVGPVVQADGKILVCTIQTLTASNQTVALYRFDPDGSADATFGDAGSVVVPSNSRFPQCEGLTRQSDGRFIVAATGVANDSLHDAETQVFRFDGSGTQDTSFGDAGVAHINFQTDASSDFVTALSVQADDAILVGAPLEFSFGAFRLDADGHADPTFAAGGRAVITFDDPTLSFIAGYSAVEADAEGRIVMTGTVVGSTSYYSQFAAARLAADGSPDASFGTDGLAVVDIGEHDAHASSAMLDGAGHILIAGSAGVQSVSTPYPNYNVAVVRLDDDGTLDATFGDGGLSMLAVDLVVDGTDGASAGLVLDDGKILLVGGAGTATGREAFTLRLDADGTPDDSYGTGGFRFYNFVSDNQTNQFVTGLAHDGDGYAIAGSLVQSVSSEIGYVARLDGARVMSHSTHNRTGVPMLGRR